MSSRQEEKERRRKERLAAEQCRTQDRARKRRIGYLVGGVLAGAAIAAIVIAVAERAAARSKSSKKPSASQAKLDAALQAEATAAGCTVKTFPSEGRQHTDGQGRLQDQPAHLRQPQSGPGLGRRSTTPAARRRSTKLVHPLEHGRVEYQYHPGASPAVGRAAHLS